MFFFFYPITVKSIWNRNLSCLKCLGFHPQLFYDVMINVCVIHAMESQISNFLIFCMQKHIQLNFMNMNDCMDFMFMFIGLTEVLQANMLNKWFSVLTPSDPSASVQKRVRCRRCGRVRRLLLSHGDAAASCGVTLWTAWARIWVPKRLRDRRYSRTGVNKNVGCIQYLKYVLCVLH